MKWYRSREISILDEIRNGVYQWEESDIDQRCVITACSGAQMEIYSNSIPLAICQGEI